MIVFRKEYGLCLSPTPSIICDNRFFHGYKCISYLSTGNSHDNGFKHLKK